MPLSAPPPILGAGLVATATNAPLREEGPSPLMRRRALRRSTLPPPLASSVTTRLHAPRLGLAALRTPLLPPLLAAGQRVPQVGQRHGVRLTPPTAQVPLLKPIAHRDAKATAAVAPPFNVEDGRSVLTMCPRRRVSLPRTAPNARRSRRVHCELRARFLFPRV